MATINLPADITPKERAAAAVRPAARRVVAAAHRLSLFVFLVASGAWFFDCLDQRIFSLARNLALDGLPHAGYLAEWTSADFAKVVTAFFLIGWGVGGMIFGSLGDRFGRARMLTITILIYSPSRV